MSDQVFNDWYDRYVGEAIDKYAGLDTTNPKGIAQDAWQAAIEADRQRRGVPVAWIRKNGFRFISEIEPQDDSEVPLYATPQPAEPNGYVGVSLRDIKAWRNEWLEANDPVDGTDCVTPFDKYLYGQPAAPAQMPSDSEIMWEWANTKNTGDMRVDLIVFARALLARYGHPIEPEGWQLVPKVPTEEMLAATSWPNCAGTDYKHMLSAAPKFGEEE